MHLFKIFYLFFLLCLPIKNCFADNQRKTILITSASGALGSSTARELASECDLIITGRNAFKLQNLLQDLKEHSNGRFEICYLDFSSFDSKENFKFFLKERNLSIDGIVLIPPRPQFHGKNFIQEENAWLEAFQTTFTGPMEVLKATFPHLSNQSSIVILAGTTSIQFQPEYGPCVIRRMWTTTAKALSHTLGPFGIKVNCLSPGVVLTDYHQESIQKKAKEEGDYYDVQMKKEVAGIPLGRLAKSEEIAKVIKFLLSKDSAFVTGINMVIDGGLTTTY